MDQTKLVSIIMPLYNGQDFLLDTIKSVQIQTYKNWELIIVDDKSTDNSVAIVIEEKAKDSRIRLYEQKVNQGAAIARNRAIKESNGSYLAFLDSDDIWKANKLSSQLGYMVSNGISFSCTYYGKINTVGDNIGLLIRAPRIMDYNKLLLHSPGNSTVIYNVEKLGKTYIPNIRKRNDYLMWLKVIKKAKTISCLEEELSFHRLRENSLSFNKSTLLKYHWKIYRDYEGLSYTRSIYILSIFIINSIKTKVELEFKRGEISSKLKTFFF